MCICEFKREKKEQIIYIYIYDTKKKPSLGQEKNKLSQETEVMLMRKSFAVLKRNVNSMRHK